MNSNVFYASAGDFKKIPGSPLAYWLGLSVISAFSATERIGNSAKKGLSCSGTEKYYRFFWEVSKNSLRHFSGAKWFEISKGGSYRKWFGNNENVINWANSGASIKNQDGAAIRNEGFYFDEGFSWNDVSSGHFSCRYVAPGAIPTDSGPMLYGDRRNIFLYAGALNSIISGKLLEVLCPTIHFGVGQIAMFPIFKPEESVCGNISKLIEIAKDDWNSQETSYLFAGIPLIIKSDSLSHAWRLFTQICQERIKNTQVLEQENNRLFIEAYGLQDELSPDVPEDQITLARADREKDCQRLISYAIGCMMGRYSLDEPSLIYAHAGNVGFDASRYATFPADADGIVPLTDELWFTDDAANRIREFLLTVWGVETLEENMAWLAESLGQKGNETPDETIRRYLASSFYKNHLQMYKKRPIYWLFSSGKQGAFQALVYLHRYNESTLARMRAEYVVPLTGKMQSRIEMLEKDRDAASSTAARNKISKTIETLRKQHVELLAYDEKLRHYADMRIQLDLDDGVKVNYGKFGDLLAEVKAVTGGAGDD